METPQTEAELQTATYAMHAAWQGLKTDTRDAQLRRAVRKACNWLKRVRSAAVVRFFERHVVELEKQLRMGDQHGLFLNIKSVQLEETQKVESQCVRDEGGRLCASRQRAYPREMGAILPLAAELQIRHARSRHTKGAAAVTSRECSRDRAHGGGNYKRKSSGAGRPSRGTAKTRTSTRLDQSAGAPPTHHPHLRKGKVPQQWKDEVIIILHKKGDKTECGDYRGILLVSDAGKVLLKVYARRLSAYCEAKGLLPEEQCGFDRIDRPRT